MINLSKESDSSRKLTTNAIIKRVYIGSSLRKKTPENQRVNKSLYLKTDVSENCPAMKTTSFRISKITENTTFQTKETEKKDRKIQTKNKFFLTSQNNKNHDSEKFWRKNKVEENVERDTFCDALQLTKKKLDQKNIEVKKMFNLYSDLNRQLNTKIRQIEKQKTLQIREFSQNNKSHFQNHDKKEILYSDLNKILFFCNKDITKKNEELASIKENLDQFNINTQTNLEIRTLQEVKLLRRQMLAEIKQTQNFLKVIQNHDELDEGCKAIFRKIIQNAKSSEEMIICYETLVNELKQMNKSVLQSTVG